MFYTCLKLSEDGRCYDGYHFLSFTDALQDIKSLRYFKDCTERTCVHTLSAIDTFVFVDVFNTVCVFADGFHRTGFFAGDRDVNDGMIRAASMADTATDASVVVNHRLPVFLEADRIFRTVHVATACHASTAQIGYLIVDLYARRTGFVYHAEDVFFGTFFSFQCLPGIFRKVSQFVMLVCHVKSHQGETFVFPHSAFLMDAATAQRFRFFGTKLNGKPVNFVN